MPLKERNSEGCRNSRISWHSNKYTSRSLLHAASRVLVTTDSQFLSLSPVKADDRYEWTGGATLPLSRGWHLRLSSLKSAISQLGPSPFPLTDPWVESLPRRTTLTTCCRPITTVTSPLAMESQFTAKAVMTCVRSRAVTVNGPFCQQIQAAVPSAVSLERCRTSWLLKSFWKHLCTQQ